MKHSHENIDLNTDFKLASKPSNTLRSFNFSPQHEQITNQLSNSDYSQDEINMFDQKTESSEENNEIESSEENNEIEETQKDKLNNKEICSNDYKKEITDFVNRAATLYSEENIMFLQKELNNKGLILSFQPSSFKCWQCVVCSDNPKSPVVLPCGHIYCQQCVNEWSKHSNSCPVCHTQLDKDNAVEIRSFLDTSPKKK